MWVSKATDWDKNHTALTKYFFEKVKQEVDYEETISNIHRTTNGFTLIKEIADVAVLTLRRRKSFGRLESLIEEAIDEHVTSNIINDSILKQYHSDIVDYYKSLKSRIKDDEMLINDIRLKSKIFYIRLENNYYENIKFEVRQIDFSSKHFDTEAKKIDSLVGILIPYLLFIGYSPTSISNIAFAMIKNSSGRILPIRFLVKFEKRKIEFEFLLASNQQSDEFILIAEYFTKKGISLNKASTTKEGFFKNIPLDASLTIFEFQHNCSDPHNFIRNLYEQSLRKHVLAKHRTSLREFNSFFSRILWRIKNSPSHNYRTSEIIIDPINVEKRKSTLIHTIAKVNSSILKNGELPIIAEIQDSVYYYNLALGSKSIENSLMLLWSSLESLIPYRFKKTDIENVQHFVSRSLSLGSIGRIISAFAERLIQTSEFHNINFKQLNIRPEILYAPEKFSYWPIWLADISKQGNPDDPYNTFKPISNLLCKQYIYLNEVFSGYQDKYNVDHLLDKIKKSQKSIEFQLDRIYLHRNQIVHSGKFINEYSNLWLHLEWYVGKLLAYCYIRKSATTSEFNKENFFMELEGDFDLIINMLEKYSDKKVRDITFAFNKLFQQTWQFF